jgi:two-component system chemotaxis response regulator CheB
VYIGRPDFHLLLLPDRMELSRGPLENRVRPAFDALCRSAAVHYGPRVIAAVLTGNMYDGADGLAMVKQCGGLTLVQDPADSVAAEMPMAAIRRDGIDATLAIGEMGDRIQEFLRRTIQSQSKAPDDLVQEEILAESYVNGERVPTEPVAISCPDCGGAMRVQSNGYGGTEYRCFLGHKYSADTLLDGQRSVIERALWTAVRALEERLRTLESLRDQATRQNNPRSQARFQERCEETNKEISLLRSALFTPQPAVVPVKTGTG